MNYRSTLSCSLKAFVCLNIISIIAAQKLSDSLNTFAISLLDETSRNVGSTGLNIALSPYTIWTLMTVISEGAKDSTAHQLETILRIPSSKIQLRKEFLNMSNTLLKKSPGVKLELDTAIFSDRAVNLVQPFELVTKKFYKATLNRVNFKDSSMAVGQINTYVAKATKDRIPVFVDEDDVRLAQLFVVSIFYFKGQWTTPFNKSDTKPETFYDEQNNELGDVDMMYIRGFFPYARMSEIKAFAVEIPYGEDKKMSMIIILPFKGVSLENVLESISKLSFTFVMNSLEEEARKYAGEDVYIHLPKFKIKSEFNLNEVLYKMGIKDIFSVNKANLLGMLEQRAYLSRLIQRADIEVDEEGTEAASVAGASFPNKASPPRFKANRPFLYFIVDRPTKSILFAGRVLNPNLVK